MTLKCPITPPPQEPVVQPKWTEGQRTQLGELAEQRAAALRAQAALYRSVDPVVKRSQDMAMMSQQMWEQHVFEAGKTAYLDPKRVSNLQSWLADWFGVKVGSAKAIREPLLNVKRLSEGLLREVGIYEMVGKQQTFARQLKAVAKDAGVSLRVDDMRRFLEEGLTPQRLAVYGNSPVQEAALLERYVKFESDMLERGFTKAHIEALLDTAADVSAQWDKVSAAVQSTGVTVKNLFNIGYIPRQFNDVGYSIGKLMSPDDVEWGGVALSKSRETWRYLPEDHALTSQLLGVTPQQLQDLIAKPSDFADFLSKAVSTEQLDLLVDSGVMSKIPALTDEVNEMLIRKYKLPGVEGDLFISDPLEATRLFSEKLKQGVSQSAMVKFASSEGMKQGWTVTKEMVDANPAVYANFVKLSDIVDVKAGGMYAHPQMAAELKSIIDISASPEKMNNVARAWQWYRQTFAKMTLGNPLIAPAYLGRQFLGNLISAHSHGASPQQYLASVMDMLLLARKGLSAFDNEKAFRIIDGVTMTHREVVSKTVRMFSHNIVPGMDVSGGGLIDWKELDPRYITAQFRQIAAAGKQGFPEFAGELNRVLGKKFDAVFTPSLKMASVFDMAGQLAVVRGRSKLASNQIGGAINQAVGGWSTDGKLDTWEELTTTVKRAFPMMDDPGKVVGVLSGILPFKAWAMMNLPIQMADMVRNPSKWYNYSRVWGLYQQSQLDATSDGGPTKDEFQPWELDAYGFMLHRNEDTKETSLLMTGAFDPRWGSLTYLGSLGGVLTRDPKKGLRDDDTQRFLQGMVRETAFADIYEVVTGIDPLTGYRRDDSDYAISNFAGIQMPPFMAAVLSTIPPLKSLDRLPFLSGTRAVVNSKTGEVLEPAVQGWLGAEGKLPPNKLQGVERLMQTFGASVRIIDGIRNAQASEAETEKMITDLNSRQMREQQALATAVRNGGIDPNSPAYRQRVEALNRMTDALFQLEFDRQRMVLWAAQNRIPSRKMLKELDKRKLATDQLPMPGAAYIRQKLDEAKERYQ